MRAASFGQEAAERALAQRAVQHQDARRVVHVADGRELVERRQVQQFRA
jgi:hypothetical protein